jgi:hypothetical protein
MSRDNKRIICALILRLRNKPYAEHLKQVFGKPIRDCSKETIKSMGGWRIVSAFWEGEIKTNPEVRMLADHLAKIHKAPFQKVSRRRPFGLGDAAALVAQPIAGVIDRVAGSNISRCSKCAKRKKRWNQISLTSLIPSFK